LRSRPGNFEFNQNNTYLLIKKMLAEFLAALTFPNNFLNQRRKLIAKSALKKLFHNYCAKVCGNPG